jgi:hypothetical protein
MSEWMDGYRHTQRWLILAGRLEGLIEAHEIMKGSGGDEYDRLLWKMARDIVKECEDV